MITSIIFVTKKSIAQSYYIMGGGLSAERVNINELGTISSYQLDCSKPEMENVLHTINNKLGYYGQPCQDGVNFESFLIDLKEQIYEHNREYGDEEPLPDLLDELLPDNPTRVYITHSYPLSREVYTRFDIRAGAGAEKVTYGYLLYLHTLAYQEIYAREDDAVKESGEDVKNIPGMLNRQQTEGPFGIWGHSIGDLVYNGYSEVKVFRDNDGTASVLCDFSCDS